MAEAIVITKMTATLMPVAVLILLEQPRKGQMPKNWEKMKLFTKIAPREMETREANIIL
jgi:hypothetical protein